MTRPPDAVLSPADVHRDVHGVDLGASLRVRRARSVDRESHDAIPALPRGTATHAVLVRLLEELERRGVRYGILRGTEVLEGAEHGRDLDLLVEPESLGLLEYVLASLTARNESGTARLHEATHLGTLHQYHLHAKTAERGHEFLTLDVHTAECAFGVTYLAARDLLDDEHARAPNRLAPAPLAVVNFLTPFLAGGLVHDAYAEELRRIAAHAPSAVQPWLDDLFGERLGEELLAALAPADHQHLERRARVFLRALLGRSFARRPLQSLRELVEFCWAARIRPLWRPRGRVLAFLGTDGSGKSTLAGAVAEELRDVYRSDRSELFHHRPGLLPQLNALLHCGRTTYTLEDMSRPHRARPSGGLGSALRVAYYYADYVLGYLLRVLPRRRRHSLILFDRYFHDYLVDPERSRIRRGTRLGALLERWVPAPDHVFVCSAPTALVLSRKEELPAAEVERQGNAYVAIGRERGFRIVRTDEPLERCVEDVLDEMFERAA